MTWYPTQSHYPETPNQSFSYPFNSDSQSRERQASILFVWLNRSSTQEAYALPIRPAQSVKSKCHCSYLISLQLAASDHIQLLFSNYGVHSDRWVYNTSFNVPQWHAHQLVSHCSLHCCHIVNTWRELHTECGCLCLCPVMFLCSSSLPCLYVDTSYLIWLHSKTIRLI